MAILIRDMTMPDCCWECELLSVKSGLYIGYVCEFMDLYVDNEIVIEGRPDWCPLEEIKPMKPKAGTVHFCGETKDVPVCPECDHMLTPYVFDHEYSEMVTYCEHCGQMIDWSEWKA